MTTAVDAVARSAVRVEAAARAAGLPAVPETAVLLGSGWGGLATRLGTEAVALGYEELPAFPTLSVPGHAGRAWLGRLSPADGGSPVPLLVLAGRQHAYETGEPGAMRGVVRTLAACGVRTLVQTNAAGSLRDHLPPGAVMLVGDHLNVVQRSPLVAEGGPERFVDMADAYDPGLRATALRVAHARGVTLHEGVYAWVLGPQFETPAEVRMLRLLGADAVGMSTVPETVLARHAGLRVLALSLITNMACGLSDAPLSHAHTLRTAEAVGDHAVDLLCGILCGILCGVRASRGAPPAPGQHSTGDRA